MELLDFAENIPPSVQQDEAGWCSKFQGLLVYFSSEKSCSRALQWAPFYEISSNSPLRTPNVICLDRLINTPFDDKYIYTIIRMF